MNLKVGSENFEFFNRVNIDMKYDAIASTFSFDFFFDPDKHKAIHNFRGYPIAKVEHNGERLITGRLVSHRLKSQPKKTWNSVSGYSLCGVLEDSNIPVSLYPLQADGLSLRQITEQLITPFNLKMVIGNISQSAPATTEVEPLLPPNFPTIKEEVVSVMDLPYTECTPSETQTIKSYLSELASQRGIVLSHTPYGNLLFTKANTTGAPVLDIDEGGIPGLTMTLDVDGQGIHSEITVLKDVDPDFGASEEETTTNPYCSILKPKTMTISAGEDADIALALKTALGQDLKNIKLTLSFDRWDVNGKIIRPNSIITVKSKDLMMNKKVRWFVESVNLKGDSKEMTSTLTCYLPQVYTGATPNYVFG